MRGKEGAGRRKTLHWTFKKLTNNASKFFLAIKCFELRNYVIKQFNINVATVRLSR